MLIENGKKMKKELDILDINDRVARLQKLSDKCECLYNFPLLKGIKLKSEYVNQLQYIIGVYLWENLKASGEQINIGNSSGKEIYFNNIDKLLVLPNITPNGLVLAKKETLLSFNLIQKVTIEILKSLGLDEFIDRVHNPVNIRLVSRECLKYQQRPRSSLKTHLDIWAGEPSHSISLFIPLFGDFKNSGVEFFEVKHLPNNLIKPLNDFNEGADLLEKATKYNIELNPDYLFLADSFLFHRTIANGFPRLSIDFRFTFKETVPSDLYTDSPRLKNYLPLTDWYMLSTKKIVVTNEDFNTSKNKIINNVLEKPRNDYAAVTEIKEL